jgi:hypothetical protein
MKVLGIVLAFFLVSMPVLSLARPPISGSSITESVTRYEVPPKSQQSKSGDFAAQGKVALGVPLFKRLSGELKIESPGSDEFKQERSRSSYRVELGYMVVRNVQLRFGLGYASYEEAAVEDEEGEYTQTRTEYGVGARYYFDLDNGFYPFLSTQYTLLSDEADDREPIKEEGSHFDLGAGILYALGGDSGGFLSLALNRQTGESELTSSAFDSKLTRKSTAINLALAAGLYF